MSRKNFASGWGTKLISRDHYDCIDLAIKGENPAQLYRVMRLCKLRPLDKPVTLGGKARLLSGTVKANDEGLWVQGILGKARSLGASTCLAMLSEFDSVDYISLKEALPKSKKRSASTSSIDCDLSAPARFSTKPMTDLSNLQVENEALKESMSQLMTSLPNLHAENKALHQNIIKLRADVEAKDVVIRRLREQVHQHSHSGKVTCVLCMQVLVHGVRFYVMHAVL